MKKSTLTVSIVHDGSLDIRGACLGLQEMASEMSGVGIAHASCRRHSHSVSKAIKSFGLGFVV